VVARAAGCDFAHEGTPMTKSPFFLLYNHARAIRLTAVAIVLAVPAFAHAQPRLSPPATNLVPSCGYAQACLWRAACDHRQIDACYDRCMRGDPRGPAAGACLRDCEKRFPPC
jgi:hypothetical protein